MSQYHSPDIGLFSFSHRNTTLEERDLLALSDQEVVELLPKIRELLHGEAAILSTCNRTELYAYSPRAKNIWPTVRELIANHRGVSTSLFPEPSQLHGLEAIRHLFRVSASLESLALGEDQILAQVKSAYELMLGLEGKSPMLDHLFQLAIRSGKQIRTDTTLCQGNVSISSVSVELARKIFGNFKRTTILLVGAGETAMNAAVHFHGAGARDFIVANRSEERGQIAATRLGGEYMPLHRLSDACVRADIAVFATGSKHHLIDREAISNIMRARRNRQLFLIDISNPRNVSPRVEEQEGVFLFNIDHLEKIVAENLRGRKDQIPLAEGIIEEYIELWRAWLRERRVRPTIGALSRHLMGLREQELDEFKNRVSPEEFALLEAFSRRLVRKIQHNPIMFMREAAESGELRSEDLDLIIALHKLQPEDS